MRGYLPAADRRKENDFMNVLQGLQQTQSRDLSIHRNDNVGSEFVVVHQCAFQARIAFFKIIDELPYVPAAGMDRFLVPGIDLHGSWDPDGHHLALQEIVTPRKEDQA